jgi:hypothetical protein
MKKVESIVSFCWVGLLFYEWMKTFIVMDIKINFRLLMKTSVVLNRYEQQLN